jgi:hypothetical protein
MERRTTAGMTAIGVANIVFGSFGLALALMAVAAAGLVVALYARQIIIDARPDPQAIRELVIPSLTVVLFAAMDLLLVISGVRVLQLSPRGRTYSLIWAGLALVAGILDSGWIAWHSSGIGILLLPFALLSPAYGLLLIVLFRNARWKEAFAG